MADQNNQTMAMVVLFILIILSLVMSSNKQTVLLFPFNDSDLNISLWKLDNENNILPKEFNRTLFVNDLVVNNSNSVIIGGIENNTPFSRISAERIDIPQLNVSKTFVVIDQSTFVRAIEFNGSSFLTNSNLDTGSEANSFTGAGDTEGNGATFIKWNRFHSDPFLAQVGSNFGNMEIFTTFCNGNGEVMSEATPFFAMQTMNQECPTFNRIKIGFVRNATVTGVGDVKSFNGKEFPLVISPDNVTAFQALIIENTSYFNQSYVAGTNATRTSPEIVINKVALFARDDGDLYIKRDNGNVRRITTANSGSNIWTEEQKFNNHTTFFGDIVLNNSVYTGGTVGYACIDGAGRLFKSATPCHLTTTKYNRSIIVDPTMGDETVLS